MASFDMATLESGHSVHRTVFTLFTKVTHKLIDCSWQLHTFLGPGIILSMQPANDIWRYFVTPSLIGWAQRQYNLSGSHIHLPVFFRLLHRLMQSSPPPLNWNINLGLSDGTWHCSTGWSILVQIMVCYPVQYQAIAINITNVLTKLIVNSFWTGLAYIHLVAHGIWRACLWNNLPGHLLGLILGLYPANDRRRYKVTPSLIGLAQT